MDPKRMGMAASLAGQPEQPEQPQVGDKPQGNPLEAQVQQIHAAVMKLSAQMDALLGTEEGQQEPQGVPGAVQQ